MRVAEAACLRSVCVKRAHWTFFRSRRHYRRSAASACDVQTVLFVVNYWPSATMSLRHVALTPFQQEKLTYYFKFFGKQTFSVTVVNVGVFVRRGLTRACGISWVLFGGLFYLSVCKPFPMDHCCHTPVLFDDEVCACVCVFFFIH